MGAVEDLTGAMKDLMGAMDVLMGAMAHLMDAMENLMGAGSFSVAQDRPAQRTPLLAQEILIPWGLTLRAAPPHSNKKMRLTTDKSAPYPTETATQGMGPTCSSLDATFEPCISPTWSFWSRA